MKNKRIVALEERLNTLNAELTKLDEAVIERGSDLTSDEQTNYDEMSAELDTVNADLSRLVKRENDIKASQALGASLGSAVDKHNGKLGGKDDDEDGIYRADAGFSFIQDLYQSKNGHIEAMERLGIHRAASASSDLPGLVVPTYLVDKYQELAIAAGPFLNTIRGTLSYRPTVEEMSVVIPKETQAPTVGAQATENSAFSTQSWTTEELTVATNTIGAYLDLSVQAVELGKGVSQDRLFGELLRLYYAKQDYLALHGAGSSGEPEGLFNADGTQVVDADTVSGFAEHIAAVQEAASKIETTDYREAQILLMSPGRWRSLLSATESTGRPLAGFTGSFPQNVGAYMDGNTKWFAGLRVVTDPNVVKSGEDDTFMAVYNTDFCYFAETDPKRITADQVIAHTGGVRFVVRGYMQFTPEVRVNSLCIIQDLTPPEFPTLAVS